MAVLQSKHEEAPYNVRDEHGKVIGWFNSYHKAVNYCVEKTEATCRSHSVGMRLMVTHKILYIDTD